MVENPVGGTPIADRGPARVRSPVPASTETQAWAHARPLAGPAAGPRRSYARSSYASALILAPPSPRVLPSPPQPPTHTRSLPSLRFPFFSVALLAPSLPRITVPLFRDNRAWRSVANLPRGGFPGRVARFDETSSIVNNTSRPSILRPLSPSPPRGGQDIPRRGANGGKVSCRASDWASETRTADCRLGCFGFVLPRITRWHAGRGRPLTTIAPSPVLETARLHLPRSLAGQLEVR